MTNIHPTALVDPKAKIAEGVEIGPYAIIDENVQIGRGTKISAHAVITGFTDIGEDNQIGVGAVIGLEPQDISYRGAKSYVTIGNKNVIREYVQIHRGTKEESRTLIGDGNFLMGFCHVAHNCVLGNGIIIANGALFGGYVQVEDFAFISGHCLVHQFCRIGKFAMMRGGSGVSLDMPPYCIADENNTVRGINVVGLERRGFSPESIRSIKKAYKEVFSSQKTLSESVKEMLSGSLTPEARYFLEFINNSERGVCRPQS